MVVLLFHNPGFSFLGRCMSVIYKISFIVGHWGCPYLVSVTCVEYPQVDQCLQYSCSGLFHSLIDVLILVFASVYHMLISVSWFCFWLNLTFFSNVCLFGCLFGCSRRFEVTLNLRALSRRISICHCMFPPLLARV